jgi:hypothetical protein
MITVPAFALHHMEEYYPDPEKFDPERFALLHKVKRHESSKQINLFLGGVPRIKQIGIRTPLWDSV